MKILSLKKYLTYAFLFLSPFVFITGICLCIYFSMGDKFAITVAVVSIASILTLLLPSIYYFYMYFNFKIKCKSITPTNGVIANWEHGFFRYTGAVIINVNNVDYSTSAYFNYDDAKNLVGKTVSYSIIDETLVIYEILD